MMDELFFIQNLDEILQMDEKNENENGNANKFGFVLNLHPSFI